MQALRGTQDILPDNIYKWNHVESVIKELCALYGYSEIRTPMLEDTKLFLRGIGDTTDVVAKEMYTFEDRGGRSITLRPENTAAVVRSYLEHKLYGDQQVHKLFYIGCSGMIVRRQGDIENSTSLEWKFLEHRPQRQMRK